MKDTKRLPNYVITGKIQKKNGTIIEIEEIQALKESRKSLFYYLFYRANLPKGEYKMCKCTFKDILEALDIKIDRNYKKKVKSLLNDLVEASLIDYRVNSEDILEIEVLIYQNSNGNFTRIPYSVGNNKDIPIVLLPTYIAILYHTFTKESCNPSINTLAKYSGCSVNTCKKRIKKLEELMLIQFIQSKGGSRKDTNTYYISNGENYFYELIEVENTRFPHEKKKKVIKKKGSIVKDSLKENTQEQEELFKEVW